MTTTSSLDKDREHFICIYTTQQRKTKHRRLKIGVVVVPVSDES